MKMTKTLKKCGKMLKDLISKQNTNSMFLHPITNNELINVINTLKNESVGGEDGVTVDAVKQGHLYLIEQLKCLVNAVFSAGVFPKRFKRSIVIPIYKSGDRKEKTNYRPIALTSTISKNLENTSN